jgi:hypothetical protein
MGTAQLHLDFLADMPGFSFPARLLLTSFRQHVGFTYYEYRLQLWISSDVTTESLESAKQQCARAAQETLIDSAAILGPPFRAQTVRWKGSIPPDFPQMLAWAAVLVLATSHHNWTAIHHTRPRNPK